MMIQRCSPYSRCVIIAVWMAIATAACSKSKDKTSDRSPDTTLVGTHGGQRWYRVVMHRSDQDAQIPFFLALEQTDQPARAVIANGDQHVEAEQTREGATFTVRFPIYHTFFTLTETASGALEGHWASKSPSWGEASIPVRALPVGWPDESKRFSPPAGAGRPRSLSPSGVWEVTFAESGTGRITLTPNTAGFVTAVVHFPNENFVYLAGNLFGKSLYLSSFDGTAPYLIKAQLGEHGRAIEGTWISGQSLDWIETFKGTKRESPDAPLGESYIPKDKKLGLPELTQPRYKGKPVIVSLSATWCVSCKYSTPVLRDLYERYHDQGLELLMFTYEFTEDEAYNKQQTELFKKAYGVTWEIIPITGDLDSYWDIIPSDIADLSELSVAGFPMAVFVNADTTVRDVHIGFPGPETGEEYRRVVDKYDRLTRAMLEDWASAKAGAQTPPQP